jgi:hypothetical protein
MYWRIHQAIFRDKLDEALNILDGDIVQIVNGNILSLPVPFKSPDKPALALTTLQDARQIMSHTRLTPWLFYNYNDYCVSYWMSNLSDDLPILNKHCMFIPSGLLLSINSRLLHSLTNQHKVFIRPNSGNKAFTGYSIHVDNWDYEAHIINEKTNLETMLMISHHIDLSPIEWRCWIVNKQIVAYSPYSWEEDIKWFKAPDQVLELATKVATSKFQVDVTYVLDIVSDLNNNYYINEINATSTSGIYDVPLVELLPALRTLSQQEYSLTED